MATITGRPACGQEQATILRSCGRLSVTAGGYVFVHDPDIPITRKPVIWRREDTTRIISLREAPHGFSDFLSLNFEALGRVLLDREDEEGRGVTVVGPFGTFSFLMDSPEAMKRPGLVIPLDPLFRSRYYEAGRFMFRYLGFSIPYCIPPVITPVRSQLLIRCLHAVDMDRAGFGVRRIAARLIDPRALTLSNREWIDHSWRRSARSWTAEGRRLVEGGYVSLRTEG
ncbi:hypothetical protein AA0522_2498 [Gluconacetobacter liquefaciens NRIC 0522]|uniref:DUF2285 domain-containing protein n=1 Tax=Gluconacetobacter liquefaciens TaxID=89584 RepID=A0A370G883_GLULI|nr:DUF2285 domain-containing protein [Gluconacetobacter liquefaciens]MBB2185533.1 DUF2285 domain-containing protein [Gluconacetobacter liquefaciens]RDI39336.1 uncharacterized protein DUF2285 [Gluconacetobacter liquefaciens]GBR11935.1 hypothetical protein AA0522_2498 [Gluconacetobacter liquefaciens NRIC 0522]